MSAAELEANSKFVFVIGFQVMMCLFALFSRKSAQSTEQISDGLDDLSEDDKAYVRAHLLKELGAHQPSRLAWPIERPVRSSANGSSSRR